jgi:hypothetical protein
MTNARGALCLQCRTALAVGEPCDVSSNHRVVSLAEPSERARALDAVWGPPHLRAGKAAAVSGSGGAAGGLFEGCGACGDLGGGGGEIGGIIVMILIVAIAAIAIWWITTRIVHAVRNHRARVRPQGAIALPVPRQRVEGKVTAGEAWGIELTHGDALGSKVTLRDGGTPGFQLTLDDGKVIHVPAGRVRLDGEGAKVDGQAAARRADPEYREHDDHAVIPWERAEEVRVAVGDRVELLGPLDQRPDPDALAGGYRDAAPSILVPAGIARLRILRT